MPNPSTVSTTSFRTYDPPPRRPPHRTRSAIPRPARASPLAAAPDARRDPLPLVERAQRGDAEAFGLAFLAYRNDVARVVVRHVAPHEIDEVIQEVAIRAFLSLGQLRKASLFRGWLTRIAHNACIDWIRQRVCQRQNTPLDEDVPAEAPAEPGDCVGELALPGMVAAIARLKPAHATALLLRGLEGFTYRRIAGELGVSLASVKTYLHRARRTLKHGLGGERPCLRTCLARFSVNGKETR